MFICGSSELPDSFHPLPTIPEGKLKEPSVKDLTDEIENYEALYFSLPSDYKSYPAIRLIVGIAVIVGIAAGIMAMNGTLSSFPENFLHFFQHMNWTYFGAAAAGFVVLTIGAAIVIHKVRERVDELTEKKIELLTGDDHWVPALYQGDGRTMQGYIDTSTVDEEGFSVAFMYVNKESQDHYNVSMTLIALTPLHLFGVLVYNIFRLIVIPFYILYRIHTDAPTANPEEAFRYSDIPDELGKTMWRIVRAPFFALADIFAALYSLVDPLNGRKLGSYIERFWNEGVTRAEGFWSIRGPQALWQLEGGWERQGLGRNGYYAAGCWQPIAVIVYYNGKILNPGTSLSKAVQRQFKEKWDQKHLKALSFLNDCWISRVFGCCSEGQASNEAQSKKGDYQIFTKEIIQQKYNEKVTLLETTLGV